MRRKGGEVRVQREPAEGDEWRPDKERATRSKDATAFLRFPESTGIYSIGRVGFVPVKNKD
jgi:hypothetical protein